MPFVELFVPKGTLREDQRTDISQHLAHEVMRAEGAPDTDTAREISWLVVHEVDTWTVGGRPLGAGDPPRYVVRVAVPAGSLDDAKRSDMIARITRVLAKADDDPDRLTRTPDAWVHIAEIPDGNWGALGGVVRLADIGAYVAAGAAP